ncbi:MAG: hypothetical protein ABH864_04695, partial [archaeon]
MRKRFMTIKFLKCFLFLAIALLCINQATAVSPSIEFGTSTTAGTIYQSFVNISLNSSNSAGGARHYAFTDFDNDVLLWMRMDDIDGNGDPTDLSSYSNNGTAEGNATQNDSGYFGKGFSFDGEGDYINLPDIFPAGAYTKAAWVKRNDDPDINNNIIAGGSGHAFWAPDDYSFKLSSGHNNVYNLVQDPVALSVGVWY